METSYNIFKETINNEKIYYPKIRSGLTYDEIVTLIEDFLIEENYDWMDYKDILQNLTNEQCQAITSYYFQNKIDGYESNFKFEKVLKSLNILK